VKQLTPILEPGGMFKKRADPETRACAAMALGKLGTPEARQVLEAAIQDKDPLVRNAVGRALRPGEQTR
jgi:HEAT repeat protein